MAWLKIDDQLKNRPEWLAIEPAAIKAEDKLAAGQLLAGRAKLLHLAASMWGAEANCDGKIPPGALSQIAAVASLSLEQLDQAAEVLVAARMWRRPKGREVASWVMLVTWEEGDQPTAAQEAERKRKARRRAALLRGDRLVKLDAIARAEGECEYCGAPITEDSGEIDHVDDAGGNEIENLAHVCSPCNRRKGDRSLAQARMQFTPAAATRRANWAQP